MKPIILGIKKNPPPPSPPPPPPMERRGGGRGGAGEKYYDNLYSMRKFILKENKGKSGIYMLSNKLEDGIYVGQSIDISNRFKI